MNGLKDSSIDYNPIEMNFFVIDNLIIFGFAQIPFTWSNSKMLYHEILKLI